VIGSVDVDLRVRYAGVPIGTVTLDVPTGLAHGVLVPGAGYELARADVESAGRILFSNGMGAGRYWSPARGDFADVVASSIAGGYELEDLRGMPVSAASVSVFAPPGFEHHPVVVVDFRPQTAHVFAALPQTDGTGGGRRRPAA
jgi:hypothetical protein